MSHCHRVAAEFMHHVYDKVKHGDEKHQAWLKDECFKLVVELEKRLVGLVAASWSIEDKKEVEAVKQSLLKQAGPCDHCECPEAHDGKR